MVTKIQDLYGDNSTFYPLIIGVKFVSDLKLRHDIPKLWSFLYDATSDLIMSGSKCIFCQLYSFVNSL